MMRSLYSGVSGLRSHQVRMDVIGANLANVNTVGFKCSRVTFRDVLYQTSINASSPTDDGSGTARGGVNPSQIGLGVGVAAIDVLNTRAGPMLTDRPYDVYIDGEGYFAVMDANQNVFYTRVGDFNFDPMGRLVDGNGNFVLGLSDVDPENVVIGEEADFDTYGPITIDQELFANLTQIRIGLDGIITGFNNDPDAADDEVTIPLGQIMLFKFINPDGLSQEGNTYVLPSPNSGDPLVFTPGYGTGRLITNRLEMSNVEVSKEFTDMIVTQRGFQANSRIITVSDEMLQELVNLKR